MTGQVIAVDLGATSGRVVLGTVADGRVRLDLVSRFANEPLTCDDGLHWDRAGLMASIVAGLAEVLRAAPGCLSIGVDSWAVDYVLLRGGQVFGDPFHYRDRRTEWGVPAAHQVVSRKELFSRNGLQFLPFTTLYQLMVDRAEGLLATADRMLLIPDMVNHGLCGVELAERTNASTTGLLSIRTGEWDVELTRAMGVSPAILAPLVDPGTIVGALLPEVHNRLPPGAASTSVVSVGSHDTASAVAAVPMRADRAAYISCGTWGLVGVELEHPVLTESARAANFSNERGVDGRFRFLRNVMGLWLLTESLRAWGRVGPTPDLLDLLERAAQVERQVARFDAGDPRFLPPGDMPQRIAEHCRDLDQPVPGTRAEVVRSILESLALAFAVAVRQAAELSGVDVRTVHVVGGGARNELLCQLTADRTGLPVVAGPVEATATGNVLVQARAAGLVSGDVESLREMVGRSTATRRFLPRESE